MNPQFELNRSNLVGVVLLVVSLISLVSFGILGVGRSGAGNYFIGGNFDGAYFYAAGRAWFNGDNPYNYNELIQTVINLRSEGVPQPGGYIFQGPFSYPPHSVFLFLVLGLLSYGEFKVIWLLLNLAAILAIVMMTIYANNRFREQKLGIFSNFLIASIIIGNPFTTHVVYMGQTALIVFATLYAAWILSLQSKWSWAGICLGVASIKPQICLFFVIWLILQRSWKLLATAAVTTLVMSLYLLQTQGVISTFQAWYQSLQSYTMANKVSNPIETLLASKGFPSLSFIAIFLGLIIVISLWFYRHKLKKEDIFSILMAITACFGYVHDYNYIILIPTLTTLIAYSKQYPKVSYYTIFLAILLFTPKRLIMLSNVSLLTHWRSPVILCLLVLVTTVSILADPSKAIPRCET